MERDSGLCEAGPLARAMASAPANTCADGRPEAILDWVCSAVEAFVGDAEQFDDLTMMCLEYRGPRGSGGKPVS